MSERESTVHYLPGRYLGVLPSLELEEYESFFRQSGDDPEAVRQALTQLMPHLGDELVAIRRSELPDGGHCRLTIFEEKGAKGRAEGFVVVTGQGQVLVGRTDRLETGEGQQLESFRAVEHEILSITVTDRHRPVGDRLDLYIVSRGFEKAAENPDAVEVYHGLIHFDEGGMPRLELAADDRGGERPTHWLPLSSARLPRWLRSWRSGYALGVDPFDPSLEGGEAAWPYEDPEADFVSLSTPWIGYGRTGELVLRRPMESGRKRRKDERRGAERSTLLLGVEISFLTLGREADGVIRGVTGAGTRHLIGVEQRSDGGGLATCWRQLHPSFPADAVFLDGQESEGDAEWPDLLVVFQDGSLERLRYSGRGRLRLAWKILWGHLQVTDVDSKLEVARNSREQALAWRQVAIFGAVEGVLELLPHSQNEERWEAWSLALEEFFAEDQDHGLLLVGLHPILNCLRKAATGSWGKQSVQIFAFAVDLLARIYRRQELANVEVISRIDWIMRSIEWFGEPEELSEATHRQLAEHKRHSKIHLRDVVNSLEGEGRAPEEIIRRCGSNIERWSSALTMMDTIWLGRPRKDRKGPNFMLTGVATFKTARDSAAERCWLAVARREVLDIHAIDHDGRLDIKPTQSVLAKGNLRVVRIPGPQEDRLLLVDALGTARLVGLDGDHRVYTSESVEWGGGEGTPGPIQALSRKDGSCLVALTRSRGRVTTFGLLRVDGDRIVPIIAKSINMHEISCLDLAFAADGTVLLLVASSLGGVVKLFSVSPNDGTFEERNRYRPAGGVSLAARFEDPYAPKRCFVGDNNGLLWCGNLEAPSQVGRLEWMFRFDAAVHSIVALRFNGERHVLVGSESGKLALIRNRDARRIWTDQMLSPIQQLDGFGEASNGIGVVAMQGGWLSTFCLEPKRDELLAAVRRDLERLQELGARDDEILWHSSDAKAVRAFYDIAHRDIAHRDSGERSTSLAEIVGRISGRERRARVLRFLSREVKPLGPEDCAAVLAVLTFRDLYRLLSYLPNQAAFCEEQVVKRLRSRQVSLQQGSDDARSFAMQAQVAALQRLGQRLPSVSEIIAAKPFSHWLGDRWVSIEMARIFLQALVRAQPKDEQQSLLPMALPHLFKLPESMVGVCADVLEDGKDDAEDFHAFHHMTRDLVKVGQVELADLERLQIGFKARQGMEPAVALLAAMGALLLSCRRLKDEQDPGEDPKETWEEMRSEIFRSLGALISICRSLEADSSHPRGGGELPEEQLSASLHSLTAQVPDLPLDTVTHRERLRWWGEFHQEILGEDSSPKHDDGPWQRPVAACLRFLRQCLHTIVEREIKHIKGEVRPFLEPVTVELDANRRVFLRLRLIPEGWTVLSDVSIRVDAGGQDGLLPPSPEDLYKIFHLSEFHVGSEPMEVEFQGYAPGDLERVQIWTTLESREGYRNRQVWDIDLPEPRQQLEGLGRSGPSRRAAKLALQRTLEDKAPVILAVVDEVLSRQTFIQEWARATRGRLVDLDAALREIGVGRTYSERSLSLELFEEVLGPSARDEAGGPVLVTSTSETIQRLLDREVPGLLRAWVGKLRERARERVRERATDAHGPALVLLVSSTHACFLRALGLGEIHEIRAHHALIETRNGHTLPPSEELDVLIQEVEHETQLDPTVSLRRVEQLGGDVHFIVHWLLWVSHQPGRGTRELTEFLATRPVKARIKAELASLSGFELLVVLVGCLAETTVPLSQARAGLIAARNYHSTTIRSQPKRIQNRGKPFTRRSLDNLASDSQSPEQVWIEGFGTLGTASVRGTNLLGLSFSRGDGDRCMSFEHLRRCGIGTWADGVYRTAEPYRAYVREIYEKFADAHQEKRDGEVYKFLFGRERFPLESLSLVELAVLPREQLSSLLPAADGEDFKALPDLVKLWGDEGHTEQNLVPTFQKIYRDCLVMPIAVGEKRWDQALAFLPYQKFGVERGLIDERENETYPVGYHFWIEKEDSPDLDLFDKAIKEAGQRRHEEASEDLEGRSELDKILPTWTPRVVLLGPGVEQIPQDTERRVAILKERDFCQALAEGAWGEELLRSARAQLKLTAVSPFQTSGPLPPGSRFFFGRQKEMSFIESNLRRASILIVGSRRVGKTSLLNQVHYWARKQPDLEPIYVDLQQVRDKDGFNEALNVALGDVENSENVRKLARQVASLRDLVQKIQKLGRVPVFLFNEIDGLATNPVVGDWRALNEENRARFVMVAYSAVAELGKVDGPFFHFTVGTSFGGRAIAPTALSQEAAEKLLGVLTGEELGLKWASPAQEKQGIGQLLQRSYRIPWVLQHFGQLLLQRLEQERRGVITLDDVDALLAKNGDVVWLFFESLDYESLGSKTSEGARRPGYQLVLFCLARKRYFQGDEPLIDESRLRDRSALDARLGFTVDEARNVVKSTISELLIAEERDRVHAYFDRLELEKALRLLTLTLALETDPEHADRYGFLMHILPLELQRRYGEKDRTLDGLIIDTAVKFLGLLS